MKIWCLLNSDMDIAYDYSGDRRIQELISRTTDLKTRNFLELIREVQINYSSDHEVCCGINTWRKPDRWLIFFFLLPSSEANRMDLDYYPDFLTDKTVNLDRLPEKFNSAQLSEFIWTEIVGQLDERIAKLQKEVKLLEEQKAALRQS